MAKSVNQYIWLGVLELHMIQLIASSDIHSLVKLKSPKHRTTEVLGIFGWRVPKHLDG
jgi:hypothetical protein